MAWPLIQQWPQNLHPGHGLFLPPENRTDLSITQQGLWT